MYVMKSVDEPASLIIYICVCKLKETGTFLNVCYSLLIWNLLMSIRHQMLTVF